MTVTADQSSPVRTWYRAGLPVVSDTTVTVTTATSAVVRAARARNAGHTPLTPSTPPLTAEQFPGIRTLVDGRRITRPELWQGVARTVHGIG